VLCKTCSLICHNAQKGEATFFSFDISLLPSVINIYHEINQLQALKSSTIQTFSDLLINAKATKQENAFLSAYQNV
jgi:serine/threonine protein kinase HipA of HipAB toxin-antitoxin module